LYIVFEYAKGGDLRMYLNKRKVNEKELDDIEILNKFL